MSRNKKYSHKALQYWRSRTCDTDEPFCQIGVTLLQADAFKALSPGTRLLYLDMIQEAQSRPEFEFSKATAKRYGISESTLRRSIKELENAGFISYLSGSNTRTPNTYHFESKWKDP